MANYEDRLTTMEAPDDNDEDSEAHKYAAHDFPGQNTCHPVQAVMCAGNTHDLEVC